MALYEVRLPQLGVNEDAAQVFITDPEVLLVHAKSIIATIETSKSSTELLAERSGFIRWLVEDEAEARTSDIIAVIATTENELASYEVVEEQKPEVVITKPAQQLITQLGINVGIFEGETRVITKKIVREYYNKQFVELDAINYHFPTKDNKGAVAIYGAGRGGYVIAEYLNGFKDEDYQAVCFVDDDPKEASLHGLPVLHSRNLDRLENTNKTEHVINMFVAIANGKIRLRRIKELQERGFPLINIYPHPFMYSGAPLMTAPIGIGIQFKLGYTIGPNVAIGDGCIIDNGVIISHDSIIEDGVHLAPGATLGSSVNVGELTIVGINASIASGITIGKNCIVSPGTSVVFDIPDNSTVEGVPGKIIGDRK